MRIAADELEAIVSTIAAHDAGSAIYIFGSRLDESKRGGDIDVLITSDLISRKTLLAIEDQLFRKIDEQRIDFVVTRKNELTAFARMVLAKGAVKVW
jgi:predicted nucleotidyltransferase